MRVRAGEGSDTTATDDGGAEWGGQRNCGTATAAPKLELSAPPHLSAIPPAASPPKTAQCLGEIVCTSARRSGPRIGRSLRRAAGRPPLAPDCWPLCIDRGPAPAPSQHRAYPSRNGSPGKLSRRNPLVRWPNIRPPSQGPLPDASHLWPFIAWLCYPLVPDSVLDVVWRARRNTAWPAGGQSGRCAGKSRWFWKRLKIGSPFPTIRTTEADTKGGPRRAHLAAPRSGLRLDQHSSSLARRRQTSHLEAESFHGRFYERGARLEGAVARWSPVLCLVNDVVSGVVCVSVCCLLSFMPCREGGARGP